MRRFSIPLVLAAVAGCNFWGSSVPSDRGGWYHLEQNGRVVDLRFLNPGVLDIRDLGCDQSFTIQQTWEASGDAMVATQSPGSPRFTTDPNQAGALTATPGMLGAASEQWLSGALCPVCPPRDAGVVACEVPEALDGGA